MKLWIKVHIKVNIKIIKDMEIVKYNILMVIFMKEILEMINFKDLEIIIIDI